MSEINTAADVHNWIKKQLNKQLASSFGTKTALYVYLEKHFDIPRRTVINVWLSDKANPNRDTMDIMVAALQKMNGKSKRAKNGQQ